MSIRLMVVDDSRFVFEEMRYLLEGTNFEIVQYCRTGEGAIENYDPNEHDLVTMDIILPGMDGFESAKAILQKNPKAVIVFISSLAYDETIAEANALGFSEFVFKPFDGNQLIAALTKAIEGK